MVNNSDTKVSYRGNGQTTVFPFSFPFIQRDYIKVAIYDSLTDETKTIDSDYYVDTVAKTVIYPGYEPGQEPAEALRPPILPATSTITIYRQTDVDQLTDFGEKYPLKDIENMADKLTEIIQEQAETLGRAVKVPVGNPKTPEEKLTDLQNYVKAAADSAADAATSEASAQRAAEAAATSEANAAESERLAGGYADTASDAASRAEDSAISARAYNAPDYDNETTYQAGDVITYTDGNSYRALQETTGNEPPNIIYWQKVTDYVGDDFFEVDEYGYIVPMDSPSHSRYWRVDKNGYIVPIEGGDGGYRPDTRQLSAEYLNVTNEGYVKHLLADDISAQEVDADEVTAEVAAFNSLAANSANVTTLTANAVNARTVTADDVIAKGPWVDVRAFGAVGDGVHDDTSAINNALQSKDILYFPKGTYILSDTITINGANKVIYGAGSNASVLKMAPNINKDLIKVNYCDGIAIHDIGMMIDFDENTSGSCLVLGNAEGPAENESTKNCSFYNFAVLQSPENGVVVKKFFWTFYMHSFNIRKCLQTGLLIDTSDNIFSGFNIFDCRYGVQLNASNNRISDGKIFVCGQTVYDRAPTQAVSCGFKINGCVRNQISNVEVQDSLMQGWLISNCENLLISNCISDGNGNFNKYTGSNICANTELNNVKDSTIDIANDDYTETRITNAWKVANCNNVQLSGNIKRITGVNIYSDNTLLADNTGLIPAYDSAVNRHSGTTKKCVFSANANAVWNGTYKTLNVSAAWGYVEFELPETIPTGLAIFHITAPTWYTYRYKLYAGSTEVKTAESALPAESYVKIPLNDFYGVSGAKKIRLAFNTVQTYTFSEYGAVTNFASVPSGALQTQEFLEVIKS